VSTDREMYQQRDRADSFGAIADDYDRYRPGYPTALLDDLVALRPNSVLDVGCGTGKAARMLAARGLNVLGVEPDPRMAAVGQRGGLRVEVAAFEDWDARARQFDLITCAQAWHWVDPSRGAPKAAGLLNPGGALALFWNYGSIDDETRALLDPVYERYAPQLRSTVADDARRDDLGPRVADLKAYGGFDLVSTRVYHSQRVERVADFVARMGTHSDHLLLGPDRLRELQRAVHDVLAAQADVVHGTGDTYLILARKAD
jgi:SAM-dependent methyltransferase